MTDIKVNWLPPLPPSGTISKQLSLCLVSFVTLCSDYIITVSNSRLCFTLAAKLLSCNLWIPLYQTNGFYNYVLYQSSCISIKRRYLTNILRVMSLVEINCTRNEIILLISHFAFHNTETSFTKTLFIVKWHSGCGISLNF